MLFKRLMLSAALLASTSSMALATVEQPAIESASTKPIPQLPPSNPASPTTTSTQNLQLLSGVAANPSASSPRYRDLEVVNYIRATATALMTVGAFSYLCAYWNGKKVWVAADNVKEKYPDAEVLDTKYLAEWKQLEDAAKYDAYIYADKKESFEWSPFITRIKQFMFIRVLRKKALNFDPKGLVENETTQKFYEYSSAQLHTCDVKDSQRYIDLQKLKAEEANFTEAQLKEWNFFENKKNSGKTSPEFFVLGTKLNTSEVFKLQLGREMNQILHKSAWRNFGLFGIFVTGAGLTPYFFGNPPVIEISKQRSTAEHVLTGLKIGANITGALALSLGQFLTVKVLGAPFQTSNEAIQEYRGISVPAFVVCLTTAYIELRKLFIENYSAQR